MSGPRAAIARLSLALRILLYTAFLVIIGYFGFSYSSGYVAVPGDMAFEAPVDAPFDLPLPPNMLASARTCLMIAPAPAAQASGSPAASDLACPGIATFALPKPDELMFRLNEGGVDVTIRRGGIGNDSKGHITLIKDGTTIERDFTGAKLPDDIVKALPESLKTRIEDFLQHPPPPPPTVFFRTGGMQQPLPGGVSANAKPVVRDMIYRINGPALFQQQIRGNVALRATLVGMTIALVVLAIVQFERLLAHFQSAELFSERNTGLMRNIGLLLVAIAIVQAVATLLPAILARALHPVILGALGPHLFLLFAGLGLCLIAQVMAEARRLEDEAAHTV
ncbi:MAG: DUF2975 domain-containing protein [Alphaproteobacteria bacterium]